MIKKKIKKITCEKHNDYDRIYLLNGIQLKDKLYKYMPLNRFIDSIDKNELMFVSPELWNDPCELKFFETDFSYFHFERPELFCMCMTNSKSENQAAAWKMYSNSSFSDCVRITFDLNQLLKILNSYAEISDKKIYIGKVIYDYSIDEINEIVNKDNENFSIFFPKQFLIQNYLTLMCLKRKPFAFENEIRIFIIDSDLKKKEKNLLFPIKNLKFNKELIKEVKISPLVPFSNDDFRKKNYKDWQIYEFELIKKELQEKIKNLNVTYSKLYSDVRKIKKVPED